MIVTVAPGHPPGIDGFDQPDGRDNIFSIYWIPDVNHVGLNSGQDGPHLRQLVVVPYPGQLAHRPFTDGRNV